MSIILGQLFGQSGKTLYINLEGYSSVSELTGIEFEKDMSDILYDMGNGSGNVAAIIGGTVNNFGTVSILPPMRSVKDLKSIAYTEWKSFLLKLEMGTDYQYIILDISDNVENPDSVIGLCEYLLVAVGTDKVAEKKVEQFLSDLKKEFDEDGRLQIIKYIIPRVDRVDSKMLRTPGNPIWDYAEKELIVNING